ncbi:MAG: 23S rRNA (pseudouridine(1915)-N(3))-methyltransferase RlmH [Clostridia bacterium]|nr:23S rRNA (pseudouridine(1915)-N(3))-methyltransferase RlmH [Clostridia bacterium]
MIQLTFVTVGTLKEGYLREALAEYEKRLSQYATVRHVELREERITNEDDPKRIEQALAAEGKRILDALPQDAHKIALCVEGKLLSSPDLAALIGRAGDERGKICFVIGSSHGLAPEVKRACDTRLSISPMTFPHQLMRVILSEAVYRSFTILAGKKYHK